MKGAGVQERRSIGPGQGVPRARLCAGASQLVVLLLAFLLLGLLYSLTVPVFEAPDEDAHFAYARYLAETWRLPVQDPDNPGPWRQEGSQPPLYYAVVALVIQGIDTRDAEALDWNNPQNVMGHPGVPGNKNRFIHTDREAFPYRGAALAVHLARLVSLLMGAGTVWLTYLIAQHIFAGRLAPALAAAALVAFLPQFLFVSGAVNNDNAVTLFSTGTLYCLLRVVSGPGSQDSEGRALVAGRRRPWTWELGLGACLGLALLSKLSALLLVPFVVLVLAVAAWQRRSEARFARAHGPQTADRRPSTEQPSTVGDQRSFQHSALFWFGIMTLVTLGMAALVAGWWFLRNVQLYGDPVASNVIMAVAGRRAFNLERFLAGAWDEFRGLRWSFWALFGWFSLPVVRSVYLVLDLLTLVAVLGLVIVAMGRRPSAALRSAALLALWLLMVFGGLVWWTTLVKGAQGRLLFPAIAPIAVLLVAGWRVWLPDRLERAMPALVGVPMLAFAVWCLLGVIRPAYARPPLIEPGQVPAEATRPQVTFGGRIRLLGVDVSPTDVAPGGTVRLTFYWQALAPVEEDALLNIRLFGHNLALLVNEDTYPGWGTFPPSLWPVGPVIVDRYRFQLPAEADIPTLVRVDVGFVDRATQARWPATDPRGQSVPSPTLVANFRLRQPGEAAPFGEPVARLDEGIVLLSYRVEPEVTRAGGRVTLTLEWGAESVPAEDYAVFLHLVDADGQVVAQADGPPRGGDYPTSAWLPGDRVPDLRAVKVPPDVRPGEYHLLVGMYRLETGERLRAYDAAGRRWRDDAILLDFTVYVR